MSGSSSSGSSPEADAAAVIVAAGAGTRMGGSAPKQYLELLGLPLLLWSVRAFVGHPGIRATIVVLPADDAAQPPAWLEGLPVRIVAGGLERADSVRNGLAAVPGGVSLVLIHDAARPLVPAAVIGRVIDGARGGAAIAAVPIVDTIKAVTPEELITRTVDRDGLWLAQTPQGFRTELIRDVHARAYKEGVTATDDAGLCERYGIPVHVVEGAPENMKITRPADLLVMEALAAAGGPKGSPDENPNPSE